MPGYVYLIQLLIRTLNTTAGLDIFNLSLICYDIFNVGICACTGLTKYLSKRVYMYLDIRTYVKLAVMDWVHLSMNNQTFSDYIHECSKGCQKS